MTVVLTLIADRYAKLAAVGSFNPPTASVTVDSFLIRGFDPLNDAIEFGRELIPRIKAGAASIDGISDGAV